jgi:SAM-dependent methyltransferase
MKDPVLDNALREGHYARKQIFLKSWLIRWSHQRRFEIALELARPFAGRRIMDYGCGDGTFLAMLMASDHHPCRAVGVEIDPAVVAESRRRFVHYDGLTFTLAKELEMSAHETQYDALFCTEVLEHVVQVESLMDLFLAFLKPGGVLIISVPVETGLPLAVKQIARRIAGWRGLGDYAWTSTYTISEFASSLLAGAHQHIPREPAVNPDGTASYGHKGFNWMALRKAVEQRFTLVQTLGSPVKWLSPHLNSQAWIIASKT